MIRPIDALAPKVYFRGKTDTSVNRGEEVFREKIALVNAFGVSAVIGAATTAVSRGAVSSWRNATGIGAVTGALSLMFLLPMFMYKSGVKTNVKAKDMDTFIPEKVSANTVEPRRSWIHNKIEGCTKSLIRKAS